MRKLITFSLLFTLTNCAPPQDEAFDISHSVKSGVEAPSQWVGGRNAFPLQLSLSNNFTSSERETIKEMATNWSDSVNSLNNESEHELISSSEKLILFNTQNNINELDSSNLNDYKDSTMGVYKITEWNSELPPTALAVTQIYGNRRGNKIVIEHADILLNYENFSFSSENGFGYDLATVVVHEMGHFLGLYHDNSSTDESIMYPSISRFTINRYPKTRDIHNLETKYEINSASTNLESSNFRSLASSFEKQVDEQSEAVVIRQELHADGKCHHLQNGKLVHKH